MESKTEARRQAILEVAAEVFREVGFERASMWEIRETDRARPSLPQSAHKATG
jgi:hypothetical protein